MQHIFILSHKSYTYQLRKLCDKLHQFSDAIYIKTYKSRHFSKAWSLLRKNEDEVTKFIVAYFVVIVAGRKVVCAENETASQLPQLQSRPAVRIMVHSINTSTLISLRPCIDLVRGEGERGKRRCGVRTISVLQDARCQAHDATECITISFFTLRLNLQSHILSFATRLKKRTNEVACVPVLSND